MIGYPIFAATRSNAITKEYYYFLVGQINRGRSSKRVSKVLRKCGSHEYFTYHLISCQ
jgi:hypothetical protein